MRCWRWNRHAPDDCETRTNVFREDHSFRPAPRSPRLPNETNYLLVVAEGVVAGINRLDTSEARLCYRVFIGAKIIEIRHPKRYVDLDEVAVLVPVVPLAKPKGVVLAEREVHAFTQLPIAFPATQPAERCAHSYGIMFIVDQTVQEHWQPRLRR